MSEARVSNPKIAVAPFLSVRNGAAAIEFYMAAFGAEVLFRHDSPDGAVVCEMGVGEGRFWLSDESPENRNFSPETLGGATARMVIELDDPDAMFERAVAAGAKVSCSMKDEYGWRIGRVSDPFGWDWEIGRLMSAKDERYIIDLCDEILGAVSSRQHRFDFLRGDTGRKLPVDAYYESLGLVVEFHEMQHDEEVIFFDKPDRMTCSGVSRGEQRKIYDQRRQHLLPAHGIRLLILRIGSFRHDKRKRLLRIEEEDVMIIRRELAKLNF